MRLYAIPPNIKSVWCVRVKRGTMTKDQDRILAGTLKYLLKDEPRPMRPSAELAPGVRVRRAK